MDKHFDVESQKLPSMRRLYMPPRKKVKKSRLGAAYKPMSERRLSNSAFHAAPGVSLCSL